MEVSINKSKDAYRVSVDGEAINYLESEMLSEKQKSLISRALFEMKNRSVRKTVFTIKDEENVED